MSTKKSFLRPLFLGFCMGIADIIPGVSGGTIAFLMGFYDRLLTSLKTLNKESLLLLFKGKFKQFYNTVAFDFLLPLLLGASFAFMAFSNIMQWLLNHETYRAGLYSLFFGLILAASYFLFKLIKWSKKSIICFCLTTIVSYFCTAFVPTSAADKTVYDVEITVDQPHKNIINYDSQLNRFLSVDHNTLHTLLSKNIIKQDTLIYLHGEKDPIATSYFSHPLPSSLLNPWLIFCGSIAISAMLLPGLSGSYLLTILGVYPVAIAAVADFSNSLITLSFDLDAFLILANLLIGIGMGAILFSRFILWLLKNYYEIAMASLIGFMIGALRSIWPFWSYAYSLNPLKLSQGVKLIPLQPIQPSFDASLVAYLLVAFLGFFLVIILEKAAKPSRQLL